MFHAAEIILKSIMIQAIDIYEATLVLSIIISCRILSNTDPHQLLHCLIFRWKNCSQQSDIITENMHYKTKANLIQWF